MEPPKRVTVNVPAVLKACLEERMRELKYLSHSAYFLSLMIFDFYKRVPHILTGSLHKERPEVQDQFYAEIATNFTDLMSKPPSWFLIRLQELVAEELKRRDEKL